MPFERPAKRSPDYVADHLRRFLEGVGHEGDWDLFVSLPLADPALEAIRFEASGLPLPLDAAGRSTLERLLAQANRLVVEASL